MPQSPDKNEKILNVSIWRGSANTGGFSTYAVPHKSNQTILDVVSWVQQNEAPDLAYRYACRVGMCGSCAMMVNGKPMWTCRTHVNKALVKNSIRLEPLRNLPVIKDLVTDMDEFFAKWQSAKGRFVASQTRDQEVEAISPDSTSRKAADAAIECINCAVCYAACDVVSNNPNYLGPAALNRAWTLTNDIRDNSRQSRLEAISGKGGCHNCHSQQGCSTYCPIELNPTLSIAGLKRASSMMVLKRGSDQ